MGVRRLFEDVKIYVINRPDVAHCYGSASEDAVAEDVQHCVQARLSVTLYIIV